MGKGVFQNDPPTVDHFLFWSLETGAFIIGYLNLISDFITFMTFLGLALVVYSIPENYQPDVTQPPVTREHLNFMRVVFPLLLIFQSMELYINILLVVGLHENDSAKIYTWIIYSEIAATIKFVLGLIRSLSTLLFGSVIRGLGDVLSTFIAHGFQMYLILVIYSYYVQIQ